LSSFVGSLFFIGKKPAFLQSKQNRDQPGCGLNLLGLIAKQLKTMREPGFGKCCKAALKVIFIAQKINFSLYICINFNT
jgi:hypothetical protein